MTADVTFRSGLEWDTVEVECHSKNPRLCAELAHLLMSYDAEPRPEKWVLDTLALRLCASELGALLNRNRATAEYDPNVREILHTHLEEVRSRQASRADEHVRPQDFLSVLAASRFKRELTPHQVRDLSRLLKLRHGANFSVPGAGKTATVLAIYEFLRTQQLADRLLVVAPKNAFLAWEDEVRLCFPTGAPVIRRLGGGYEGAMGVLREDPEICVITYQFLPNVYRPVAEWAHTGRTHLVLDEAHRIKAGISGVTAGAALKLAGFAIRRDILTGTPLPQSPEDLRPQLEFLWPGQRVLPEMGVEAEPSDRLLDDLQEQVRPLYVRTTKSELKLPPIKVSPISVELGPVQREIYELLRSEARRGAAGLDAKDRAYFRDLGRYVVRLLEAASNPMLITQEPLPFEDGELSESPDKVRAFDLLREFAKYEKPAKVAAAVERASEALRSGRERKVLLWSSFVQNIFLLERNLKEFNPVILFGGVATGEEEDPETREGRIRRFHDDPSCQVMIANPAACGEAISLHQACHYAIYVDRTFNAAHYLQSIDRIHRLGLAAAQVTTVEVLEAEWTIDGRVARRLKTKIKAMSQILDDPGLRALAYDPEDIVEEFPAGLEPQDVEEVVDHLNRGEQERG